MLLDAAASLALLVAIWRQWLNRKSDLDRGSREIGAIVEHVDGSVDASQS
jgi:hypothetical protein